MQGREKNMLTGTCFWCREPLVFDGAAWVHAFTGNERFWRCRCGWTGALRRVSDHCPACGNVSVLESHIAIPDYGSE